MSLASCPGNAGGEHRDDIRQMPCVNERVAKENEPLTHRLGRGNLMSCTRFERVAPCHMKNVVRRARESGGHKEVQMQRPTV